MLIIFEVNENMRDIKFRAWFIDTGHGEEPRMVQDYHSTIYMEFIGLNPRLSGYAAEIMQFTGLKDQYGNEIYEGDILQIETDKIIGVVHYNNAMFKLNLIHKWAKAMRNELYYFCENENVKIIGNIYENPELLERGREKENYKMS